MASGLLLSPALAQQSLARAFPAIQTSLFHLPSRPSSGGPRQFSPGLPSRLRSHQTIPVLWAHWAPLSLGLCSSQCSPWNALRSPHFCFPNSYQPFRASSRSTFLGKLPRAKLMCPSLVLSQPLGRGDGTSKSALPQSSCVYPPLSLGCEAGGQGALPLCLIFFHVSLCLLVSPRPCFSPSPPCSFSSILPFFFF